MIDAHPLLVTTTSGVLISCDRIEIAELLDRHGNGQSFHLVMYRAGESNYALRPEEVRSVTSNTLTVSPRAAAPPVTAAELFEADAEEAGRRIALRVTQ